MFIHVLTPFCISVILRSAPDRVRPDSDGAPDDPRHPTSDRQLPVGIPRAYSAGPCTDV